MMSLQEQSNKIWSIAFKNSLLGTDSREDAAKIQTIAEGFRIADGIFDGTTRRA